MGSALSQSLSFVLLSNTEDAGPLKTVRNKETAKSISTGLQWAFSEGNLSIVLRHAQNHRNVGHCWLSTRSTILRNAILHPHGRVGTAPVVLLNPLVDPLIEMNNKWRKLCAMCDALQLARTSQHRSMKQWRQESLEGVRTCMSRWLMEHQAWLEELQSGGALFGKRKRGLRVQSTCHRVGVSSGTGHTTPTPRTTSSLLGTLIRQTRGRFS